MLALKSLGPYEILSPLGSGGMGEVYRARDSRLDRVVAIKILHSRLADEPGLRDRFEREARVLAGLNHPHICALYDIGRESAVDYLVMEYLDGQSLARKLEEGALPIDQAILWAMQLAEALDQAHRRGILHRDVKPGNIMLTASGIKLMDFGLAKASRRPGVIDQTQTAIPTLTVEGTILGTLPYMAPEQLVGAEVDARTDIFALGSVFYE
jgi:eukaryotic-like serine/threonine-protein kinase